jgi:hypothetical protein
MSTPQQRSLDLLRERGYLAASVERRRRFPAKGKHPCPMCGQAPMIDLAQDLWGFADIIAMFPNPQNNWPLGTPFLGRPEVILVQTTSRSNHATRRNKILGSMEAKLVLLSGVRILIQSWDQPHSKGKRIAGTRWEVEEEWIALDHFQEASHYPNSVKELLEIRRKEKKPAYPSGSTMFQGEEVPF